MFPSSSSRLFTPSLISPQDELDDLRLFNEAISKATASRGVSPKISHLGTINPKPKIAFLFLTNSDLVFAPLWQRFFESPSNDDLFNVYIHVDPSTKILTPEWFVKANFIPAKTTARASPTLISAARRLLAHAIIDDPFNLYFALVSQHCIPLHSFKYIYTSLFGNPPSSSSSKAFLTQRSHTSYIEILSEARYLYKRYVARGYGVMLPEIPFDKFKVGSQFFVLAKRHALVVLKDKKLWRKFKLPCLYSDSCFPEEHYFPTLLSMEDPKGCSHYALMRVNWTDSVNGHPHTYHSPEISPELIHTLRKSSTSSIRIFCSEILARLLETVNGDSQGCCFQRLS
ncbi:DnaJ family protein [Hibiscus syriacus]|uniref:DnaJ family protein n=1 Tax=Hibiscus syriacus TaxID=106335 RepID=A0A6A2XPP5_HIBSY|nr:DnaJ family protein [Hibiscus syriacus]